MDEEIITKKLLPKFGKYLDNDDYDNPKLSYIFEGIISAIGDLISIKKNLKKFALEIYNEYISYVPDENELQKNAYNRIIEVMTQ